MVYPGYVKVGAVVSGAYSNFDYFYQYKDHLGNVRLTYGDNNDGGTITTSEIVEQDNYYAFGMKHVGYNYAVSNGDAKAQKYKYLGQERQDEMGLNWDTFRYRNYDYAIGRFFGIDPIAEKYMSISTYQFAHNNPVWKIEIEGLEGQETQGKDAINHEPVKVVITRTSPGLAFIGGGLAEFKVVQKTTQEAVKETVKKESGMLVKGLGLMFALLTDYMSPNYGGRTDEMDIQFIRKIEGESVKEVMTIQPWGARERAIEEGEVVYRGGSFTDSNFTPRPGKDDGVGPKSGLSTFTDPVKAAQMAGSNKAQGLSVELLKSMGFQLTKTPDGHVGIRPPSQELLEKWAATRGLAPGTDPSQILTQMVKSARIEEAKVL